jgi:hypothetical protein
VTPDSRDPLDSARITVAAIFLWAGTAAVVLWMVTRDWRLLTLAGACWTLWTIFRWVLDGLLSPLTDMLANLLTGSIVATGGTEAEGTRADARPNFTIDEERAMLERHLEQKRPAHQQVLTGIRLAEIYRTHEQNSRKAEALIARLCELYPDAPELRFVRRT